MTSSGPLQPKKRPASGPTRSAPGPEPLREPTAFVAGAVVLALAALVAVAARGTPVWKTLRDGRVDRSDMLVNVAVYVGAGIVAALAVALVVHRFVFADRAGAPPLRTLLRRALPIAPLALAVLALLAIARTDLVPQASADDSGQTRRGLAGGGPLVIESREAGAGFAFGVRPGDGNTGSGSDADQAAPRSVERGEPDPDHGAGPSLRARVPILLLVLGVAALAIAGAAVWRWLMNRSADRERLLDEEDEPQPDEDSRSGHDREAARAAVAATIDAMLADDDPNTAIIGAYARLLEGLAAHDAGRRDHEAPLEHLHRALATLDVRPEPLRKLIELFEIARFSTHPLADSHRDQALDVLRAAAADLAGADVADTEQAGADVAGATRRPAAAGGAKAIGALG